MFTYLLLNILFLITLIMFLPNKLQKPPRAWWITLYAMFLLTLVFDPIIILMNVVDYDATKILGFNLLGAPIEDFFYALYAACIVPLIWNRLGERTAEKNAAKKGTHRAK